MSIFDGHKPRDNNGVIYACFFVGKWIFKLIFINAFIKIYAIYVINVGICESQMVPAALKRFDLQTADYLIDCIETKLHRCKQRQMKGKSCTSMQHSLATINMLKLDYNIANPSQSVLLFKSLLLR